jgi:hypothetical protein
MECCGLKVWSTRPEACQLLKKEGAEAVIVPVGTSTLVPPEQEGSVPPPMQ